MPQKSDRPLIVAMLGPTAVGKSRLATNLAVSLNAEIVSVDSMQIYRGMDIGTAKPDETTRQEIPHHMIDVVYPCESYSAAEFQKAARAEIDDIASRNKIPLLVGGTGLYFEAVVFDMRFPPGSVDARARRTIEEWAMRDPEGLRKKLREVDPEFAGREDYSNLRRVIRAMEVYESTGVPFSAFKSSKGERRIHIPYIGVIVSLPRLLLYEVIDERVDRMIEAGLVKEVARLKSEGHISRTARQALGYKEILDHLDRGKTLEETVIEIKKRSRRYAKRQLTWFRNIPGLRWFELEQDYFTNPAPSIESILEYLEGEIKRIGHASG